LEFGVPLFSRRFVRRRVISLATSLSVTATSFALAQDPRHHSHVRTAAAVDKQQFLFNNDLAMSRMARSMLAAPTRGVDRDFVDVMTSHHRGMFGLARADMKYGHDDPRRRLASRPATQRKQGIAMMHRALSLSASATPAAGGGILRTRLTDQL
jgi:uncharacterized protein (DUF305 family)